jgi:chromosome partitioning protein
MILVGCLSQKGGVGKSTLARLIARTYASGGWRVKIADFNVKQKTSVDWAALRMAQHVQPEISAEAFTDVAKVSKLSDFDLAVMDGRPESDSQTERIARESTLVVIPCGVAADDLVPQVKFAHELRARGVPVQKLLFVVNKTPESPAAIADARNFITQAGYACAENTLPMKTAYVNAHNSGRCLAESEYPSLNERAIALAQEIVDKVRNLEENV